MKCPYCKGTGEVKSSGVVMAEQKEAALWRPWDSIIVNKEDWVTDSTNFTDYGDYRYVF